ncbi:putative GTP-binding protein [Phytophthora rubi]|uniref:Putative GTP-binding protein n=1 Tax=Phytophthora rubi TaxID=129364 RepID=A0A6A3MNE7_9STRA|nr:putative GTP-binding protein [Phytophthora rubi]KAE9042050.1 putative GTP-binding protein [Phytophthora rubi]KAE9348049.1 putative GTP-binding protein [Phytophthora rubi]
MELVIGCVGKPSAGKSTFFNAVTDGKAKVGNFPFTTIEPNEGITYYMTPCPCLDKDKTAVCAPRYGKCEQGTRYIPVKLLDVAGLIPGASEGAGLGNKFLDDLRHAQVLMHIIDVSGHTNEKGEETVGYDPINDADWLDTEIHQWVFNNLWKRWTSIARRHKATKSSLQNTFIGQLSGYGATPSLVSKVLDRLGLKEPLDLATWMEDDVHNLVKVFLDTRFPTVLVLNKADQGDDTDRNIEKIVEKYGSDRCFVASAAAECFLRAASKQRSIRYEPGSMFYSTLEDDDEEQAKVDAEKGLGPLKPIEKKIHKRLERISDMVLFRYGSSGVRAAINAAVELADVVVVYPVKSLKSFATNTTPGATNKGIFADAVIVKRGTTIKELALRVSQFIGSNLAYAEGEDGRRRAEDEPITTNNLIIKFTTTIASSTMAPSDASAADKDGKKGGKKGGKAGAAASAGVVDDSYE